MYKPTASSVPTSTETVKDEGIMPVSGRYAVEYIDAFDCWSIVDNTSGDAFCEFDNELDCTYVCECLNYTNYDRAEWRKANEISC